MKIAIAALILVVSSFAQSAGQLSLAGLVVNSKTGAPIAHAQVTINLFSDPDDESPSPSQGAQQRLNRTAFTDSGGSFRFTGLPKGNYNVMSRKPEFNWDTSADGAVAGQLALAASVDDYVAKLSPLGVITGTVVDQDGLPLPGIHVIALSVRIQDGVRQIKSDRNVTTDDRGVYRLWNLTPGNYFLKAEGDSPGSFEFIGNTLPSSSDESFQMVYFGGSHSLDSANPIEIGPGTEGRADFSVNMEQAFRVTGSIANFVAHQPVTFELVSGTQDVASSRVGVNTETGRFLIGTVVPGSYVLRATQGVATAEVPLTVKSSDLDGVTVMLTPPVDIPVVTTFTNAAKPVAEGVQRFVPEARCNPILRPAGKAGNYTGLQGRIRRPGLENIVAGVSQGTYIVSVQCFGGYAHSATAGSQDLGSNPTLIVRAVTPPTPIEIVAAHGGGSIKGRVDIAGVKQITILLVPQFANPAGPIVTQAFAREKIADLPEFEFRDLAPGTYTAWAFPNQDIEFRNPEFLRRLSGGTIVQVDGDGEKEVTIKEVVR